MYHNNLTKITLKFKSVPKSSLYRILRVSDLPKMVENTLNKKILIFDYLLQMTVFCPVQMLKTCCLQLLLLFTEKQALELALPVLQCVYDQVQ